jgi:hypothetical protein
VVEAIQGLNFGKVIFGFPGRCVMACPSDQVLEATMTTTAVQYLLDFPFFFAIYYNW